MRMDVVASSSGSFKVSARKRKMGQVDVDDDSDGELKDLEVIWNKGFVDNEDQKVVDVYKVTQQPPSLKVLKKHRSRKPFVKKRKTLFVRAVSSFRLYS